MGKSGSDILGRALGIAGVAAVMGVLVFQVGGSAGRRAENPSTLGRRPVSRVTRPVSIEADVFRMKDANLAVALDAPPRSGAEPRRLALYRSRRAFPGAPPAVPHGLTAEEFRLTLCGSCHLRGGYVARFGKYAPITPHPEYRDCLACHVPDATKVGIGFPEPVNPVFCSQCHRVPDLREANFAPIDWKPAPWPSLDQRAIAGGPPMIPHQLQLRGNCLACHAGPSAVVEIRTSHPEWTNCLQCHVHAPPEAGEYQRR